MRADDSRWSVRRSRCGAPNGARWWGAGTAAGAAVLALVGAGCGVIDLGGADYRAEALIRVDPGLSGEAPSGGAAAPMALVESFIEAQLVLVTSREVLEQALDPRTADRVIEELDWDKGERTVREADAVRDRAERIAAGKDAFLGAGGRAAQAARLGEMITVKRVENSLMIAIGLEGDAPQLIADLVNSVVDSHVLACADRRKARAARRHSGLASLRADVQARLAKATEALMAYQADTGATAVQADAAMRRLEELQTARTKATLDMVAAELEKDRLQAAGPETLTPEMTLQIQADLQLARLRNEESQLAVEQANLAERMAPTAEPVRQVEARLAVVRKQMAQRQAELAALLAARQKADGEMACTLATRKCERIGAEYEKARLEAEDVARRKESYDQLVADRDALATEAQTVNNALTRARIQSEVSANNVAVEQAATVTRL